MTHSEYLYKDSQLMQQIADYNIHNSELRQEIAMNDHSIANLKLERARLMITYNLEQENK